MSGSAVLDRIANLENAVFGGSGPALPKIIELTGSADVLAKFGIYLVNSSGVNNMTLISPTAGAPGKGQDGQRMRIYNLDGHAHTITAPADQIFFANNNPRRVATFTTCGLITFIAFNGQFYTFEFSSVSFSQ